VYCFPEADPPHVLPAVGVIKALPKARFFVDNTTRTVWILSACWIALSLAVFLAVDASSTRSWIYLAAVALLPPIALIRLWPGGAREQTAADVIHGRAGQP